MRQGGAHDERRQEATRRAASALRERVEPQPPPIVDVRRRRSTRRRAGPLATFVVAAGAAILATGLFNGGGPSRVGHRPPAQSSPSATTVPPMISPAATSPSGLFLVGTPPKTPPAGWRVVDYHGFRQFLPPAWTVVEPRLPGRGAHADPGRAAAQPAVPGARSRGRVDLARARRADLAAPTPAAVVPAISTTSRAAGSSAKPPTETWLIDGLDVALVDAGHRVGPGDWQTIESSWQYTDPTRPEAGGPGTYGLSQPGYTAYAYVQARLAGNCAAQAAVVDRTYTGGCAAAQPGRVPATSTRFCRRRGLDHLLPRQGDSLVHRVRREAAARVVVRKTTRRVEGRRRHDGGRGRTAARPEREPAGLRPVAAPSGKTPGCAKKAELFPSRSATARPTIPDQVPVYASPKSTRIVGYMVQGAGYVRKNLAKRIPELRQCFTALQGSAPLTPSCRALLLQDGYDRHILARHP